MGKIRDYFRGKNLLVTGATGFCGKVLVEKLLRSCEGVGKIYVLIRKKKNASPYERYMNYVNHFIFDNIRATNVSLFEKIIFIGGDIEIDDLQMDHQDELKIINDVNIIFHCAANIKFNDPIKNAVNINVTGTLRVLQLAAKVKHLEVFSYMSTAFCQSFQEDLDEKQYKTCVDAKKIIEKTQLMDSESLVHLERELLEITKHHNTYTLSKALAEDVVCSYCEILPIVIIRPSLVWGAVKEPCIGFIEGLQSTMGLICGAMTGFIRNMYSPLGIRVRCSPVDFVINATIASAWKRSTLVGSDEVLFYNCTDADENPMTWQKSIEISRKYLLKYAPYKKIIWYPKITCTTIFNWHLVSLLLFQLIPAFLLDGVRFLSGKKPILTSIQFKIIKGLSVFYYFVEKQYRLKSFKLQELFAQLDEDDRDMFCFDHKLIDWEKYHDNGVRGIRKFLLKDDESTMEKAQRKLKKFYIADLLIKAFMFFIGIQFVVQLTVFLVK